MPAFFFISGIFAIHSVRSSPCQFIRKKLATIAYPYLIWSIIQTTIQVVLSGHTTHQASLSSILQIAVTPINQYWFLYALFFISIISYGPQKLKIPSWFHIFVGLMFLICLRYGWIPGYPAFTLTAHSYIYFGAGIFLSNLLIKGSTPKANLCLTMIATTPLFSLFPQLFFQNISGDIQFWLKPFFAIPGTLLILSLAWLISSKQSMIGDVFMNIGRKSLEIFVAHTIFSAGYRIVLLKIFHINDLTIHLSGAVIIGIIGPLLLVWFCNRIGFRYAFTWPKTIG